MIPSCVYVIVSFIRTSPFSRIKKLWSCIWNEIWKYRVFTKEWCGL